MLLTCARLEPVWGLPRQAVKEVESTGMMTSPSPAAPENHLESERLRQEVAALRQQVQQLEADSDARYRALFEVSFEGVLVHDNQVILDCNPAFERMFGYPAPLLKGREVLSIIDPAHQHLAAQRLHEGSQEPAELILLRADGSRAYVELVARNTYVRGQLMRVVALRDISARKESALQEHRQRLLAEALRDCAAALNHSLDPDEVMQSILEQVGRVVPHDTVNIAMIEGDRVLFRHWRGYPVSMDAYFQHFTLPLDTPNLQSMIQSHQPFFIPDTEAYPHWVKGEHNRWIRAYAAAPIILDEQVVGFINLNSATPYSLTDNMAQGLQAFANQAAIALKNAQLYEQAQRQTLAVQQHNLLLQKLNALANQVFTRLEGGSLLTSVARLAAETIDSTSAYICDYDPSTHLSTVLAEYISPQASPAEKGESDLGTTYNLAESFDTEWMQTPYAYLMRRIDAPETMPAQTYQHLLQHGIQTTLSVSLWVQGQPIGFIALWESRHPRDFSQQEIDMLQTIARQVSSTLERARLLAALKESERRHSAVLRLIPDNFFRINRRGDYVDVMLVENTSLTREGIVGHNLRDYMPPEVAARGQYYINKTLDSGMMHIYEYQLPDPAGPPRDFEARLVVYDEDDVLAIVRDITLRKQAERELALARDEALQASRAKTNFLANVSHELRTPLNSIINYTQLLINGIYGNLNATQRDRLEKVERNSRNLLALINDVLDLSKIEAGHLTLRRQKIHTLDFINAVLESFQPAAEERGIQLLYEGGDMPDLHIDETRARQILNNIVGNAIKFTHNGSVSLRSQRSSDTMLCITVTDTGIGIPKAAQESIFDQFYQVDSSPTREYEGTGLGLTISRRLARMHGGDILVKSEEGQGSTFLIYLPLHQPQP